MSLELNEGDKRSASKVESRTAWVEDFVLLTLDFLKFIIFHKFGAISDISAHVFQKVPGKLFKLNPLFYHALPTNKRRLGTTEF